MTLTRKLTILALAWAALWTGVAAIPQVAMGQVNITAAPMAQDILNRTADWWGSYMTVCPPQWMTVYRGGISGGIGAAPNPCTIYVDTGTWDRAQGWPLTYYLEDQRRELFKLFIHEHGHWYWDGNGWSHLAHWEGWVMDEHSAHQPYTGAGNVFARGG